MAGSFAKAEASILKDFGSGALMRMGDKPDLKVKYISTGCVAIDRALGGGIGLGRVAEIYGPESSGKSTLALHLVREAQLMGLDCAYIDAEHALDPDYAEKAIGVDIDSLLINQPDNGEQGLEITDRLCTEGNNGLIIVDSVAALVPRAEIEGEMGDSHMGLMARLMSQAMRKITHHTKENNVSVLFINQLRMKIGVVFGNPEVTPGGNALKYYASQRMDIRRIESIKQGDEVTGARTRIKVVKNKLSPPHRQAEFDIMYGEGISREGSLIDLGLENGIVKKSGAWYSVEGQNLAQGKENLRSYLKEHKEVADKI